MDLYHYKVNVPHNLASPHLFKSTSHSSSKNLSTLARLDLINFPDILNT